MKAFLENTSNFSAVNWEGVEGPRGEGWGRQTYKNGTVASGFFHRGSLEGNCSVVFPDKTEFNGLFQDSNFTKGRILYFGELEVSCVVTKGEGSKEDFMRSF